MSTHEIVILGGHYGGLGVAHYLLRHVIPQLTKLTPTTTYHVTIVSPTTHFYFNIAAPRALINDKLIPTKDIFLSIADIFKKEYKPTQYTILQGKATALDPTTHSITVTLSSGATQILNYASLVLATGKTSNSPLWSVNEAHSTTEIALKALHQTLPKAKTILVAGGGAVGVETVGELATHYPKAKTTLLSGGDRLLPRLLPSNSRAAQNRLKALGADVVHHLRVTSAIPSPDGSVTTLVLSDGSQRIVDVYINATGGVPNTSFLPKSWLDDADLVPTDATTLRPTAPGTEGVYAIGDLATFSDGGVMTGVNFAVPTIATAIGVDIAKAAGKSYPGGQKAFKPMHDTQVVPTGPKGGVGQVLGYRVPSFMVWAVKSRTYLMPRAPGFATGADFVKA